MNFGGDGRVNIIIFTSQNTLIWNKLNRKLRETSGRVDDLIPNHPPLMNELEKAAKGLLQNNRINLDSLISLKFQNNQKRLMKEFSIHISLKDMYKVQKIFNINDDDIRLKRRLREKKNFSLIEDLDSTILLR